MMKRLTLRLRLTLVYGGLFLLAGVVLLGVTYVLVDQRTPNPLRFGLSTWEENRTENLTESLAELPSRRLTNEDAERLATFIQQVQADARDSALESLLTQGGLALVIVSAAAIAFGWLIAGRALQPLHQITGTARRIASADTAGRGLHERIALRGPRDEVRELADTFDLMLERLDRSFDGQRRFVANASHELRTPLALNRTLVELAVTRPDAPPEVRQLGETLLAVNERHERLIEGLLTLAESESGVADRTPVDLAQVAAHVVDQASAGTRVAIHQTLAPAPTAGDPVLLERVTQNLVENAVRHNVRSGGWVWVRTGLADGRPTLTVENTGPVVPPYEIDSIFEPFRRARQDRVDPAEGGTIGVLGAARGFGLGLSIVRSVTRAHGGSVAARPRDGGGLTVTVTLPTADDPTRRPSRHDPGSAVRKKARSRAAHSASSTPP